ncbi:MAG TPA: DUF2844 domain-containing protein [Candidatus Eremiobacteraceae bacterium]|nr:DUF2844 domain-containing protein [Candidatus Eremiobacteraceae bacterium]
MSKAQMGFIRCGLLMAAVILATAFPARAALGGDASTIQADQVHMQGSRRAIAAESYTVHEIQGASGTVVREYFSSPGIVFAVSWHGPWQPDMRQILGSYFEPYAQAVQSQRNITSRLGRRPVVINQPGLIVQSGGHPRSFVGKAYIPDMLPANVRAEDIQ